ncbi:MAG: catalase HPII, partial [bacterium]|nr:catalase HPII [bacterium]
CFHQEIRERELDVLAQVDSDLAAVVGDLLGLTPPKAKAVPAGFLSPALSQVTSEEFPTNGRVLGVVVGGTADVAGFDDAIALAVAAGVAVLIVAPTGAPVDVAGVPVPPDRTYATTRSIEFDAVIVIAGPDADLDPRVVTLIEESYRHGKALAFVGGLTAAAAGVVEDEGAVTAGSATGAVTALVDALKTHRVWSRLEAARA